MLVSAVPGSTTNVANSVDASDANAAITISFGAGSAIPAADKPPVGAPVVDPTVGKPPVGAGLPQQSAEAAPRITGLTVRTRYDQDLNRTFLELYDQGANQVIVQFPPETLIRYLSAIVQKIGPIGARVNYSV